MAVSPAPTGRPILTSKLAGFGTTIFAEMSALAVATGAINLGQGFPDTDGPSEVLEAAIDAIRSGVNQYPPGPGLPVLREAVARHQQRFYGLAHDPDTEVLVTAGATEALAGALLGILDDGDEVVVFEPMYDSYQACIALAGARAVPVLLRPSADGQLPLRPRRAARCRVAADAAGAAQHAAQPDRQGVRRATSWRRSPRSPSSTTCSSSPTRCTSTSCSPAPPTSRSPRCRTWPSAR